MENELKCGDYVLFQGFIIPPETVEEMPTIPMIIKKVESISDCGTKVKFEDMALEQPVYRIRKVFRETSTKPFSGYNDIAIARDEGKITDETYEAIMKTKFETEGGF